MDSNADPSCSRTMDQNMALEAAWSLDASMVAGYLCPCSNIIDAYANVK